MHYLVIVKATCTYNLYHPMKSKLFLLMVLFSALLLETVSAQEKKKNVAFSGYDGVVVAGYIDQGAFLNFAGPNITYRSGFTKVMLGMLPSLRYKEDEAAIKNSSVLPVLGIGLSYSYKHLVLQLPLYYNAKTATKDGCWKPGLGIGYRFYQ